MIIYDFFVETNLPNSLKGALNYEVITSVAAVVSKAH
jgi:hypothetical protein